jgi:hypothetical protein
MKKYDVVAVGNSPKVFIELLKYAKDNKKCLIIGQSNWKSLKLGNINNVEDGCFFIDYNEEDYQLLIDYLDIDLEIGKFEPFFLYKNKLYPISSNFLEEDSTVTKFYKYPKNGLQSIIEAIQKYIKKYSIDVLDIIIDSIYVDFNLRNININNSILANKLLTGYNLNLSKISSNKSDFIIDRRVSNIFTYLLVHIKLSKINFSFIDFSYCKDNLLPHDIKDNLIFYQKNENKFLWRVKDVTQYSTLNSSVEKILCIDTKSWLPKEDSKEKVIFSILNFLKDKNLIDSVSIKNFSWHLKNAYTIESIANDINKLYFPYIKIINPLFLQKEENEN